MTPELFADLAKNNYNRIPVMREVLADLDTPLSTYLKLANAPYSYLFESVEGGEQWGRYSIIGLPAQVVLKVYGYEVIIEKNGEVIEQHEVKDPLDFVEQFKARYRVPELPETPRFCGGLVGYFGYDTVRYVEKRLAGKEPEDKLHTPEILLMVSDELVVFDNLTGRLRVVVHADPSEPEALKQAELKIDELVSRLRFAIPEQPPVPESREVSESEFISSFGEQPFKDAVAKIKEYVLDGDIMQAVISQRMSIPFEFASLDLYRALRGLNPSPYMYMLNLGEFDVVGSSPEILARVEDRKVTVRPIAGTRRRGRNRQEDLEMEQELLGDPKEIAEHLMLIDLGRNDAGRVSAVGEVQLTEKMVVERYSHVMHIVSNVEGVLRPDVSCMDVLRATLPAGTLSGAPKVRAMEIIDELEPVKRGVYGGAVGYLSWNGNMDTAIAIRTAVIKDQVLHIQAGAGIVADSLPELEWKETMNKGRAIFAAVDLVAKGL